MARLALRHAGVNLRATPDAMSNMLQQEQHAVLLQPAQLHATKTCQHVAPHAKVITPVSLHAAQPQPAVEHVEINPHAIYRQSLVR